MDKQTVLKQIKELTQSGTISKKELIDVFDEAMPKAEEVQNKTSSLFYYIGGIVVFVGVSVLVGQHWKELSVLGKLLATLGIALTSYIAGVIINQKTEYKKLSDIFFCISALLSPLGFYIAFQQAGIRFANPSLSSLVSCVLLVAYLSSYFLYRRRIFIMFSIIFGTWFFYAFTSYVTAGTTYAFIRNLAEYKALVVGLAYVCFGYYFSHSQKNTLSQTLSPLTPWLYGLGTFATLFAGLFLTGWQPNQNIVWELIYPFLIFASVYASAWLKNKSFLFFGSFFLVAYLWKLTFEYFTNSLGWPLTFIIGGFIIIGIGFVSFRFNKKYLKG